MQMLEMVKNMPANIERALKIPIKVSVKGKVTSILLCGMGASGISGDILADYLKGSIKMPVVTSKSYDIPAFVSKDTLVFIISYSGKTAETLSMLRQAKKKKAKVIVISSKGFGKNSITVPSGLAPRMALPFLFFSVLLTLEKLKLVKSQKKYIKETIKLLKKFDDSKARKIATQIWSKVPVIYAPGHFASVVLRWRTELNENSKVLTHTNTFTELNHNEIESIYSSNFHVIILRDKEDTGTKKQIDASKKIIQNYAEIHTKGTSLLARMFYAIYFGDWVSYHLSKMLGRNPNKTPHIDFVKSSI